MLDVADTQGTSAACSRVTGCGGAPAITAECLLGSEYRGLTKAEDSMIYIP